MLHFCEDHKLPEDHKCTGRKISEGTPHDENGESQAIQSTVESDNITEDQLRAVIRVTYMESRKIDTRVFFRRNKLESDFRPIKEENLEESIDTNFISLDVEVKEYNTKLSKLTSEGNYDFPDYLPIGYLVGIKLQHGDEALMKKIAQIVRAHNFTCYIGNYTSSCNLADSKPSVTRAYRILRLLCDDISKGLASLSKTELMSMGQYVKETHKVPEARAQLIAPTALTVSSSHPQVYSEPKTSLERKKKNAGIAIAIAIISPLFGYAYLGKWLRGLGAGALGSGMTYGGIFFGLGLGKAFEISGLGNSDLTYSFIALSFVGAIAGFYVWMIRDLRRITRLYNTTGFEKTFRYRRSHRKRNGIIIGCVVGALVLGYAYSNWEVDINKYIPDATNDDVINDTNRQTPKDEDNIVHKKLLVTDMASTPVSGVEVFLDDILIGETDNNGYIDLDFNKSTYHEYNILVKYVDYAGREKTRSWTVGVDPVLGFPDDFSDKLQVNGYINRPDDNHTITNSKSEDAEDNRKTYTLNELKAFALQLINNDRKDFGKAALTLGGDPLAQQFAERLVEEAKLYHCMYDNADAQNVASYYEKYSYVKVLKVEKLVKYTLESDGTYYTDGGSCEGGRKALQPGYEYIPSIDYQPEYDISCSSFETCEHIDPMDGIRDAEHDMMYDDAASDWGHRDNILGKDFTKVSIGIAYNDWLLIMVQNFHIVLIENLYDQTESQYKTLDDKDRIMIKLVDAKFENPVSSASVVLTDKFGKFIEVKYSGIDGIVLFNTRDDGDYKLSIQANGYYKNTINIKMDEPSFEIIKLTSVYG